MVENPAAGRVHPENKKGQFGEATRAVGRAAIHIDLTPDKAAGRWSPRATAEEIWNPVFIHPTPATESLPLPAQ